MTPEEFTTLKNERDTDPLGLGLPGCGPEVLVQKLNADGSASVETWVVSDTPRTIPKSEVLALLSFDIKWSLYNERGEVVNGREDVVIDPPAAVGDIVLHGGDLLFKDGKKRTVVVEATYTGQLGYALPVNDSVTFFIDDLPGL